MSTTTNIVWFRNDLRVENNATLQHAIENSKALEAVYILPKKSDLLLGEAAKWYLHKSLIHLESSLYKLGIILNFYLGDADKILKNKIHDLGDRACVFSTQSFNPIQIKIDNKVNQSLPNDQQLQYIGQDMIISPLEVKNSSGGFYKIYTPFANKFKKQLKNYPYQPIQKIQKTQLKPTKKTTKVGDLKLLDKYNWYQKFENYWSPGERNAKIIFEKFIHHKIMHYTDKRNNLDEPYTSKLSASINFGEISIAQMYFQINQHFCNTNNSCEVSVYEFLDQLIWREFAKYSLYYQAESYLKSINRYCDSSTLWNGKDMLFELWKKSKTGIDIIDSAMAQLWEEGWMHNRARMFAASFLTKNLGIHWTKGANWFWNTLVDADLAANTMGWQWVSGTAPYSAQFTRVFNPLIQAKKFDKKGLYIKKYLTARTQIAPIVSIKDSAQAAKLRYEKIKKH